MLFIVLIEAHGCRARHRAGEIEIAACVSVQYRGKATPSPPPGGRQILVPPEVRIEFQTACAHQFFHLGFEVEPAVEFLLSPNIFADLLKH